jgi:hypothetical protein
MDFKTGAEDQGHEDQGRATEPNPELGPYHRRWRSSEVLLRTSSPNVILPAGQRVRILRVRLSQDPDDEKRLVVSMVATSEWLELAENARLTF